MLLSAILHSNDAHHTTFKKSNLKSLEDSDTHRIRENRKYCREESKQKGTPNLLQSRDLLRVN